MYMENTKFVYQPIQYYNMKEEQLYYPPKCHFVMLIILKYS